MSLTIALFGEAQRGQYHTPFIVHSLDKLEEIFGTPPEETAGLPLAIQSILLNQVVVYFRVHTEGVSLEDYYIGLRFLESKERIERLDALCLPGVGDSELIERGNQICDIHSGLLICQENDLYDYLTSR